VSLDPKREPAPADEPPPDDPEEDEPPPRVTALPLPPPLGPDDRNVAR